MTAPDRPTPEQQLAEVIDLRVSDRKWTNDGLQTWIAATPGELGDELGAAIVAAVNTGDIDPIVPEGKVECPVCGHPWRHHDPEDGRCDTHADHGLGVCPCGRDLPWMTLSMAALSRAALRGDSDG